MPKRVSVKRLSIFKRILFLTGVFLIGVGVASFYYKDPTLVLNTLIDKKQESYGLFLMEIYDKIKENYWDSVTDEQLANLYKLAAEKFATRSYELKTKDRVGTVGLVEKVLADTSKGRRKEITVNMASAILVSLNPVGRSGLYNQKSETQLKNTVNNVNPQKDLYKDLGLNKGSSKEEVADAYKKQSAELEKVKESSPEAKKKLEEISYAKEVLSKPETKANYDKGGVEPTASSRLLTQSIFYIKLDKFSPTTFDEFKNNLQRADRVDGPNVLVVDLRGNVGGEIDITPNFLGVFIGKNQYAFDFYHKGDYLVFRTTVEKLVALDRYKKVAVLADNQTQSSAEILAAAFKRTKVGVVVGMPTKGWGTVERVFPLEHQIDPGEKYSVFLVHSVTIRDDGLSIEGRGVEPDVNIKDSNWKEKLSERLKNMELESQIIQLLR